MMKYRAQSALSPVKSVQSLLRAQTAIASQLESVLSPI